MKGNVYYYLSWFAAFSFLCASCAVEAPPLGGPKDTTPPMTVEEKSTANYQTNFEKQTIELVFDEWVQLRNPAQINVSPPLKYPIQSKLKGKTLFIQMDSKEELKEDVTYTISMGDAIVDYTEGNPMDNYSFVFATGDSLDSLSLKGQVIRDETKEPVSDVMVLLYDSNVDSLFLTTPPFYFVKTDQNGQFQFNNLRNDTFYIYALEDKNLNYYKDLPTESYGFISEPIILSDTTLGVVEVPFFTPSLPLRLFSYTQKENVIKLVFSRDPREINYEFSPYFDDYATSIDGDTLLLYHKNTNPDRVLYINALEKRDTIEVDTVSLLSSKSIKFDGPKISVAYTMSKFDSLRVYFNLPIQDINESLVKVVDSTGNEIPYEIIQFPNDSRELAVFSNWKDDMPYSITFLEGALKGLRGEENDSLNYKFTVNPTANYGELIVKIDSAMVDAQYIVQIKDEDKVIKEWSFTDEKSHKRVLPGLKPGKYQLRLIIDKNRNGKWDSGDYKTKRFSEPWLEAKIKELKADWSLEIKVKADELQ